MNNRIVPFISPSSPGRGLTLLPHRPNLEHPGATRECCKRLLDEVKPAKVALVAVMRKMIVVLNRLLRDANFTLGNRHRCFCAKLLSFDAFSG